MGIMLIVLFVGVVLGFGRSVLGGIFLLCCDIVLGIIGDKYGLNLLEGIGILGIYISGSIFGILLFLFLVLVGVFLGFYLYVLVMVLGMGSGLMMGVVIVLLMNIVL